MTTATFVQPDFTTQDATTYKGSIDASMAVLAEVGQHFACHAADTPDMTLTVDAGRLQVGAQLVSVAQQVSSALTAPSVNPRIDRVVIDATTGAASIVTGTEAASPSAPNIPAGKLPCAKVALVVAQTTIQPSDITDERTHVPTAPMANPAVALFMWANYGGL